MIQNMTRNGHWKAGTGLVTIVAMAMILCGCPLVSEHPLSDPATARIDEALLGVWKSQDPESGEWRRLTFQPFDGHGLVASTPADKADAEDSFHVFTTEMEGERFLNIRELDTGMSGWYLLRYVIDGQKLVMTLVDDGLFKERTFKGSAELYEFVRQNISDPRLYASKPGEENQDMIWERI